MLHNSIFPNGRANTRANQRLQHILDTAEIRKMITGENIGDEGLWNKASYQAFFRVLIDLIVELLGLIIKPFDNQTES